jgi:hypothetical protein
LQGLDHGTQLGRSLLDGFGDGFLQPLDARCRMVDLVQIVCQRRFQRHFREMHLTANPL